MPGGWTVVDNKGNGQVWRFDDPGNRGNLTGGTGKFAIIDSDNYGSGGSQDTSLVSPVVDMTAVTAPVIGFNQDLNYLGEKADVDVRSTAGPPGRTSCTRPRTSAVARRSRSRGGRQVRTCRSGSTTTTPTYEWWWKVDNVLIGSRSCDAVGGGIVVGNVEDADTNGVNGAIVTSVDKPRRRPPPRPRPRTPA